MVPFDSLIEELFHFTIIDLTSKGLSLHLPDLSSILYKRNYCYKNAHSFCLSEALT